MATVWFWYGAIWRVPHGKGVELTDSFAQLVIGNSYTLALFAFIGGMIIMLVVRHHRGSDVQSAGTVLDPERTPAFAARP